MLDAHGMPEGDDRATGEADRTANRAADGTDRTTDHATRHEVTIDRRVCIGSGACASTAPHVFSVLGTKGHVRTSPTAPDPLVVDAAQSCLVEAITLRDVDTGERIAPRD
ncbi:hypothetical protein OK074_1786 [Actinobacteria bacterium OK074]|nr:hypothetical protein OK074_1786 [Actinobacteria bacterium OK074]